MTEKYVLFHLMNQEILDITTLSYRFFFATLSFFGSTTRPFLLMHFWFWIVQFWQWSDYVFLDVAFVAATLLKKNHLNKIMNAYIIFTNSPKFWNIPILPTTCPTSWRQSVILFYYMFIKINVSHTFKWIWLTQNFVVS